LARGLASAPLTAEKRRDEISRQRASSAISASPLTTLPSGTTATRWVATGLWRRPEIPPTFSMGTMGVHPFSDMRTKSSA
jgi:hypothetical protein